MDFTQLIRILRAHAGLILLTLVAVIGAASVISLLMPRKYTSASSIVVDFRGGSPISANVLPAQLYSGYLATQLDIITSQSVALKVVDDLNLVKESATRDKYFPPMLRLVGDQVGELLDNLGTRLRSLLPNAIAKLLPDEEKGAPADSAAMLRYQLAEQLLKRLELKPTPDSSVVRLLYSAADPQAAADAANAFVRAYMATNLELNVNPARHSSEWLDAQTKVLADNVAKARAKYSAYQQETGIIAVEENLDVENARLTDLSSQLVSAQSQNHPAIQALKADLARAEAKFNDLPPQFGSNHPTYRRAKAEIASLRSKLAAETRHIAGDIQGQLAAQKNKILQMKKQRGELMALKTEVDSAQRALDDAIQRSTQMRMESQVNQTNVSIVRSAVPPLKHSSPNLPLNLALGAVIGIVLAVGLALWRELNCRYVRGKQDLKEVLGIPVLGVLDATGRMPTRQRAFDQPVAARLIVNR